MLTDIDQSRLRPDLINMIINGGAGSTRLAEGVYDTGLNFGHTLKSAGVLKSDSPFHPWDEDRPLLGDSDAATVKYWDEYGQRPADTGVCDNWEQIIEKWPEIVESDRHFIISLAKWERASEPASGGWRWHKWGDYIGAHEPQCEYLHDEPEIESVCTFHIYEVRADQ